MWRRFDATPAVNIVSVTATNPPVRPERQQGTFDSRISSNFLDRPNAAMIGRVATTLHREYKIPQRSCPAITLIDTAHEYLHNPPSQYILVCVMYSSGAIV